MKPESLIPAAGAKAAEFTPFERRCCDKAQKLHGACVCEHVVRCHDHGESHVGRH